MPSTPVAKRGVTYQFKGYLTRNGHTLLDQRLTENRRLYNAALEERIGAYKQGRTYGTEHRITFKNQSKGLTDIRGDDPDFNQLYRRIQISTLQRLDRAYQAFFRRVKAGETPGFPRFKGRNRFRTLSWHSGYENNLHIDRDRKKGRIHAQGMPRVEFKLRRDLPDGQPKKIRITKTARRVVVSLTYVLDDMPKPSTRQPKNPVGIDAGVKNHVTLSTGESISGRTLNRRRLKCLQRKVSRAKRGSRSRRKKVAMLSREWQRVREQERGATHELSRKIVDRHDFIAIEKLAIPNMTRSAKGTPEEPGKGVKAKSGLNRSIMEQGWGRLYSMMAYKAEWAGKRFVEVDPKHTSQTCSTCGTIDGSSRQSQSEFQCTGCGYAANADVNAASNILRRGLETAFGPGETIPARSALQNSMPIGVGDRRTPRVRGTTASAMLPGFF